MSDHKPCRTSRGFVHQDQSLREVAFPLGGIGTGCISLEGRGALRDWEIFNCPNKGSLLPLTFPLLWWQAQGQPAQCRVIQGPIMHDFSGRRHELGYGVNPHQGDGLPCFAKAVFHNAFPLATVDFHHPACPLEVSLEAWSPFIPLDEDSSGFPVACLTYRLHNPTNQSIQATVALSMHNAVGCGTCFDANFDGSENDQSSNVFRRGEGCHGLWMTNALYPQDHPRHGTMALTTRWPEVTALPSMLRSRTTDALTAYWNDFRLDGRFDPSSPLPPGKAVAGSLGLRATLAPGQRVELPLVISWCFPNASLYWGDGAKLPEDQRPRWRNHYATRWPTAWDAAEAFHARHDELRRRSLSFADAMLQSSLPDAVVESAMNTASILRSPTCLRLEDGTFWGWEGCSWISGSCEGSCTHVWNYALTPAFLFPKLHQTMRASEYQHSFDSGEKGRLGAIVFRIPLPLGTPAHLIDAAADGQLGGIVQLYRDWRLSGDDAYLRRLWPGAQRALEFAWHQWDLDRDGLVDGEQHNTYDICFYGPNPMIQGFYLAALLAGSRIAGHLGQHEKAAQYQRLFETGQARTRELFNGEYFEQALDCLAHDAPRYQHGRGCLSDQLFGQLAATLAGLGHVFDPSHVRLALQAIHRHNFRNPLGDHANPQRIYALNDEAGLILCSWPRGDCPPFPFFYSEEVWTGIEYQVATHMILEGMTDEGLSIVQAIRDRHDGRRRNPFNEFECGSHYARAMAAWGLVPALSGFRHDAVDQTLTIHPPATAGPAMRSFFSTGSAWGEFQSSPDHLTIQVHEGMLQLRTIHWPGGVIDRQQQPICIMPGQPARFTATASPETETQTRSMKSPA